MADEGPLPISKWHRDIPTGIEDFPDYEIRYLDELPPERRKRVEALFAKGPPKTDQTKP